MPFRTPDAGVSSIFLTGLGLDLLTSPSSQIRGVLSTNRTTALLVVDGIGWRYNRVLFLACLSNYERSRGIMYL